MISEKRHQRRNNLLEIALDSSNVPLSSLSSLLRVMQAALREVARGSDDTRDRFVQRPYPVLHLSASIAQKTLVLVLTFADPLDSTPMSQLSARTFSEFMGQFGEFIKGLPQISLWGESVAGIQPRSYESAIHRRLDQLRLELRRLPKVSLRFNRQMISFEGHRMAIE